MIKKNDVFFAIKGKRVDGNKFISEAFKKKSSFVIVNQINKKYSSKRGLNEFNNLKDSQR